MRTRPTEHSGWIPRSRVGPSSYLKRMQPEGRQRGWECRWEYSLRRLVRRETVFSPHKKEKSVSIY